MKNKEISLEEAAAKVENGMTLMVGGFTWFGNPYAILDELVKKGVKDLTLIANDASSPTTGHGKMVSNHQFKKIIATHVGRNPEVARQYLEGETKVELLPQGTLAEKIRAAGAGLGGFYTPTGVGTEVEEGKEKRVINGREYLFEEPLFADVALIKGNVADRFGNVFIRRNAKSFNTVMAMAARTVIAQVDQIVEVGELDPEMVTIPGILVDYLVEVKRNG